MKAISIVIDHISECLVTSEFCSDLHCMALLSCSNSQLLKERLTCQRVSPFRRDDSVERNTKIKWERRCLFLTIREIGCHTDFLRTRWTHYHYIKNSFVFKSLFLLSL